MRTKARITVTVPKDLVEQARADVAAGRATSVSAWVSDAMQVKAGARPLAEVLEEFAEEMGGPITDEERAWARARLAR